MTVVDSSVVRRKLVGGIPELYAFLQPFKKALVFAHANPDADAYGSSCGLALGLRNLGIATQIYNESGVVERYALLPGVADVRQELPALSSIEEDTVVIVCDCGAAERLGESYLEWFRSPKTVVNIDHHHANSLFGDFNLVAEDASSTSEIIYTLLTHMEHELGVLVGGTETAIDTPTATSLLAGIIGDTGSFRYPSTSERTFLAAAELYRRGARPSVIAQELFSSVSLPAVRLQSEALANISIEHDGRFAAVTVTSEMVQRLGAQLLDADSLAERARDIKGVIVSALFKQDVDMWRVSLRSRSAEFDVSAIARSFGGGGHKPAAAFRWRKDFTLLQQEVRERVGLLLDGKFVEPEPTTTPGT